MRPSAASLLLPLLALSVSAQIYHPPGQRTMWDTWIYEEKGEYHLFFLQSDPGQVWNTIGRAVSTDLLHWRTLPPIASKASPGNWDHEPTLTGITVKQDHRYVMFYGGATKDTQRIGVMFSPDLKNWSRYERNPILAARPPHYGGADWRDLFTWRDPRSRLWHAVTCARTAGGQSAIGHLTSANLLDWDYLPPLYVDASFSDMEVPEPFEMNGRHYLLFSNIRSPKSMSGRKNAVGTYYVVSDRAGGPYRLTPQSLLLGSGNKRFDVYVGRTLKKGRERLLYSQTVGGTVSWSTPKVIRQNRDGSLWLAYWPGLDRLETAELLRNRAPAAGVQPVRFDDAMITLSLDLPPNGTASIGWREGCEVSLNRTQGTVRIAQAGALADELSVGDLGARRHRMRLLVRAGRAEVYLDDRWLFNYRTKGTAAPGRIGLSGNAQFRDLRVAAIEPSN